MLTKIHAGDRVTVTWDGTDRYDETQTVERVIEISVVDGAALLVVRDKEGNLHFNLLAPGTWANLNWSDPKRLVS